MDFKLDLQLNDGYLTVPPASGTHTLTLCHVPFAHGGQGGHVCMCGSLPFTKVLAQGMQT